MEQKNPIVIEPNYSRPGPKKGQRNRLRHGLRCSALPKNCRYIQLHLNSFRRQLEDEVLAVKGQVSLLDAATIQTCLRWERHSALAARWLRLADDKMKPAEKLQFHREVCRASSESDKSLRELQLDKKPELLSLQSYVIEAESKTNNSDNGDAQ